MVFSVPAQQVAEGTSGQFKKRGQALLKSDKTSRAGDRSREKSCCCLSLFMSLIPNVFFNFVGAGKEAVVIKMATGEL